MEIQYIAISAAAVVAAFAAAAVLFTQRTRRKVDYMLDALEDKETNFRFREEQWFSRKFNKTLNRLRTMGMIETRRGDGSYVKKMGANLLLASEVPTLLYQKHDFIDILEFRKGVEIESVKIASKRRSDDDILQMKGALLQMKRNIMVMDKFFIADDQMHMLFAKATGNEMFTSMLEIIQSILTEDMKSFLLNQGTDIDSYFYHESILSCIENKKPEEAGFMMDRHLSAVIERIRKYYKGDTPKVSLET